MRNNQRWGAIALLASGSLTMLVGLSSTAIAQQTSTSTEQVTVVAPYITHTKVKAKTRGVVYSVVSMTGAVSYSDLDLSKTGDAFELKKRIADTAKSLCDQLKTKLPEAGHVPVSSGDCVKTATNEAMETADLLLSAYAQQ
jgi:UrcA family protein